MTFRKSESGFTLIELLVVVAMIMLLAGALTSAIAGAAKQRISDAQTASRIPMTDFDFIKNTSRVFPYYIKFLTEVQPVIRCFGAEKRRLSGGTASLRLGYAWSTLK